MPALLYGTFMLFCLSVFTTETREFQAAIQTRSNKMTALPESSTQAYRSNRGLQPGTSNLPWRGLWADCDRGMAAQRRLTGTNAAWPSAQRIVCISMRLISVTRCPPGEWPTKGNKHQNDKYTTWIITGIDPEDIIHMALLCCSHTWNTRDSGFISMAGDCQF